MSLEKEAVLNEQKRLVVAVPVTLYVEIDPQEVGFYDAHGVDAANETLRELTRKYCEKSALLDYTIGQAAHPVWISSNGQYEEGDALGEAHPYEPEISSLSAQPHERN